MDDLEKPTWQVAPRRVTIGVSPPGDAEGPTKPRSARNRARFYLLVGCGIAAPFMLEAALSSTALITPINHTFLWAMRALGAFIGLAVGILTIGSDRKRDLFRKTLTVLFMPLMIGFLCDGLAWHMADWWEFGMSRATFAPATYPIQSLHHGRKGSRDTIEIDPFDTGEATHIPLPPEQYRILYGQVNAYCVIVQQRRSASGAIEIRTDGEYTLMTPDPLQLAPCATPANNPWSPGSPAT